MSLKVAYYDGKYFLLGIPPLPENFTMKFGERNGNNERRNEK